MSTPQSIIQIIEINVGVVIAEHHSYHLVQAFCMKGGGDMHTLKEY